MRTWIAYATKTDSYDPIAYVTTEEAMMAIDRLFGRVRWWYLEDIGGDPF